MGNRCTKIPRIPIRTENGVEMEYGFAYTIELLKSYFVRVENGSGNWQPELAK